jgi:6-pyruvoyltetrahydropterin/6-carboxytetrahydropterin synthase
LICISKYISIDGWKSNICFSAAHIIPEYEKCGRLHGHTYAVHIKIFGETDEKGIITDFSIIKRKLREIVNDLDHKVLIPRLSRLIKIRRKSDSIELEMLGSRYVFPEKDCELLPINSTSAENLAEYILNLFVEKCPMKEEIEEIHIGVDEGYGQGSMIQKKMK